MSKWPSAVSYGPVLDTGPVGAKGGGAHSDEANGRITGARSASMWRCRWMLLHHVMYAECVRRAGFRLLPTG